MKEQSIEEYGNGSPWAKELAVAEAKAGKTSYLVATALGVFPGQKLGGIVSRPENLHVLTFDSSAAGGLKKFLTNTCKAPAEALKFRIYNMEEEARPIGEAEYDRTLFNSVMTTLGTIAERATKGGVHVLLISSLTGLALALHRSVSGPAAGGAKGQTMNQDKWMDYGGQLNEIRNVAQQEFWHTIWEGHIYFPPSTGQGGEQRPPTLQIYGRESYNFPMNTAQVFRIRRSFGKKLLGGACDETWLDPKPGLDFIAGGRSFNESLNAKEPDPVSAFRRLSLKLGHWGYKKGA